MYSFTIDKNILEIIRIFLKNKKFISPTLSGQKPPQQKTLWLLAVFIANSGLAESFEMSEQLAN